MQETLFGIRKFVCEAALVLKKILGKFSRNELQCYAKSLSPFDLNQIRRHSTDPWNVTRAGTKRGPHRGLDLEDRDADPERLLEPPQEPGERPFRAAT